jgi:hypothetical protein
VFLIIGLAVPLTHCGDDDGSGTPLARAGTSGEAGEGSGGDATGSGASNGQGGSAEGVAGGNAGSAGSAGSDGTGVGAGGAAGGNATGNAGSDAGGSNGTGGACTASPEPTNCCDPEDPPCEDGWELGCYGDVAAPYYCCDTAMGARRSCTNDLDNYYYDDVVCLDECTGKSFGTTDCSECIFEGMPACAGDGGCDFDDTVCANTSAGYVLDCSPGSQSLVCVCDPAL